MKLLVHGDILNKLDIYKDLGITVLQEIKDGNELSYILLLPDSFCIKLGVGPKLKYLAVSQTHPYMSEYVESGDESLNDFILNGKQIVASGSFVPASSEETSDYDYEAKGMLRFYNDSTINTINYTLSSEIEISQYHDFIDRMLRLSSDELVSKKVK